MSAHSGAPHGYSSRASNKEITKKFPSTLNITVTPTNQSNNKVNIGGELFLPVAEKHCFHHAFEATNWRPFLNLNTTRYSIRIAQCGAPHEVGRPRLIGGDHGQTMRHRLGNGVLDARAAYDLLRTNYP